MLDDPLNSALERRAKLEERRRISLQRHTRRVLSRFAVLLAVDMAGLFAARLAFAWLAGQRRGALAPLDPYQSAGPLADPGEPASLVFWVAMIAALMVTGAYTRHRRLNTPVRLAVSALLGAAAATVPLAAVVGLERAVVETGLVAGVVLVVLIVGRQGAEFFMSRVWPGDRSAAPSMLIAFSHAPYSRIEDAFKAAGGDYRITRRHYLNAGSLPDPALLAADIGRIIDDEDVEALIVTATLPDLHLRALVDEALFSGALVLCPPRAVDVEGLRPRLVWHYEQPLLEYGTPTLQLTALLTKRVVDIVGATSLLLLASPLMALIAAGVKLDSPGRVFFFQDRAGQGGRRFRMLKFRTMRAGADAEKEDLVHLNHTGDVRLFKIRADPRVTRFGRFLRRWSLDELPQVWNVLRGDMSLVGPRPFFQSDFAAYDNHHFRRLDTKPGITGLWQVGGRSDVADFEEVVYLDRQYIEQWSLWLDLSILLRTVPSVIRRTGAY